MLKKILTGIKPTGHTHIGNYIGAIKPSLELSQQPNTSSYLFIADSHSLTNPSSAFDLKQSIYQVAATWLACGFRPKQSLFLLPIRYS